LKKQQYKNIFFWQEALWEQLTGAWEQRRMPHGVLLAGPAGMGKRQFARELAGFMMCRHERLEDRPCGACAGCAMMRGGGHPDFRWETVPEDRKTIGVDQTRKISEYMRLTSFQGGYKVVVIADTDLMTRNAANSLLKTLEEPAGDALIILVSGRPDGLLPTVRSRCQLLKFSRPPREQVLTWLHERESGVDWARLLYLSGGAPLRALEMHEQGFAELDGRFCQDLGGIIGGSADPVAIAKEWSKYPPATWLEWLQIVVIGLIRARTGGAEKIQECEPVHLISGTVNINLSRFYRYLDDLVAVRRQSERGSLRADLIAAAVLIPWASSLNYRPIYQEI
jgi:DNA polymerase-3 subunit delta'